MTELAAPPWKSLVVDILYGTQLAQPAPDAMLEKLAQTLVKQRYFPHTPATYYEGVQQALQSDAPLAIDESQSEPAVKDLFQRLLVRLDEMRPWPVPAIRKMTMETWPDFIGSAILIGHVAVSEWEAQRMLYAPFLKVPDDDQPRDDQPRKARLFQLQTGDVIALRTTPAGDEARLELLVHRDATTALDDFRALTTLDAQPVDV